MPGKHITQQQETIYMKSRQRGFGQETSSAKTGISVRSGRRIEKNQRGRKKQRHWRTRQDPFEAMWETEVIPPFWLLVAGLFLSSSSVFSTSPPGQGAM